MSENPPPRIENSPDAPVTVDFLASLADFEAYRKQAQRRRNSSVTSDDAFFIMYLVAGLAIVAGLVAFAVGTVVNVRNPTVPLLCGVTFYAGRYIEARVVTRRRLRVWRKALVPLLEAPYTITVDAGGVALSSPEFRQWSSWSRIKETTSREGVIVFWVYEAEGIVLPRRAVSDEDATRIFAFSRAPRRGEQ